MTDPIHHDLLRLDPDPVLQGGWSPTSGLAHFPRGPVCPYTGADDVESLDLPTAGTVWLWTNVNAPPPGYTGEVPYDIGVVVLDDPGSGPGHGLRLVTRLVDRPAGGWVEGTSVRLRTVEVPLDGDATAAVWAFGPGGDR